MHDLRYGQDAGRLGASLSKSITSGGSGLNVETDRVLAIDETSRALAIANEQLDGVLGALTGWLDEAIGPVPEKGSGGASAPMPSGRLHGLRSNVENTQAVADALRVQLSRLQDI